MSRSTRSEGGRRAARAWAMGLSLASLPILIGLLGADQPNPRALVQVKRHLFKIGVELHRYHDAHGKKLPASAIRGKDGKPLLSWRVALLPMLGEVELYNKFKLDEPWDSPANRPLLDKMPAVYAPFGPLENPAGSTYFQVLFGPGTMFEGGTGHDLASIPDGADATLLVVEAAEAVPWTSPVDLVYDPKGPLPRLGGHFKDGSLALFAEGSVAFIKDDIDEPTLRALITRNGAEVVERRTLRDHVVPVRRP
jgi:hypothetical protein